MRVYNHKTLKLLNSKPLVNDIQFTNFRYLFHSSNNLQKICSSSFCSKISGEPQKQFQKGPLDGIKVLDLSRILAGPFCTMLLGDLGAEIFKIEHPSRGDDTRTWGPPFTSKGNESAYFLSVNRNKSSLGVDLKLREGKQVIYDLVKICDVVVENFPPGKAEKLGVDYKTLSELNSKIVYASITGFGPDGPYKERLAYDVIAAGMGGLLSLTGPEDGEPCKPGVALTDVCAGLFAHGAIIAALYSRDKTGKGQKIETSLLEAQVGTLVNAASAYLVGNIIPKRLGTAHTSIVPYQGFPTKDGHIIIGALNDSQFQRLCKALDLEHLASDPNFLTNPSRVENRKELLSIFYERTKQKTTDEWIVKLEKAHVPCGPINTLDRVFNDPQVLHRNMLEEVEHPTAGKIKLTGLPVKFSETPASIRSAPPTLGQHTIQVLKQVLNYEDSKIYQLQKIGAITQI